VENKPLVMFIRNYIRDPSGIFSISSLVKISLTSFPAFNRVKVNLLSYSETHFDIHDFSMPFTNLFVSLIDVASACLTTFC